MAATGRFSLSGAPCSERFEGRDEAFRKLLCDVSQHLHEEDVQQMEYIAGLPGRARNSLHLLTELHKRGRFSPKRAEPLSSLLRDVNRHDLVGKQVDEYLATYPDVEDEPVPRSRSRHSLPSNASPRIAQRVRRANTETDASLPGTPKIVVDHVSEKDWARPHLTREINVAQEVGSRCAAQQVNPSLLRPPSSDLDREASLQHTALYRGRSHSCDSTDSTCLDSYPEQFELSSSPPQVSSPTSPPTSAIPILDLSSSPQVPGRRGRYDRSTASSPDRSHHYFGDEGNRSDTEHHHSRQSSPASSIHIHLHLPESHSSESLRSASDQGQGAGSPRSRLRSAPEQDMRKVRSHPRVCVSSSVPRHTNGYLQSEEQAVNCSSEQLQTSVSESEEFVGSGERPLTLRIDGQLGKGERPREHRERFRSDDTLTPDSPRLSSVEKNHDSGKHDQEEETKQNSVKETSQALVNAHHRPQNRSQRIFQRLRPSKKSEPRTISWIILREKVSEMVWKHEDQGCVQCPEQLQVDARCGDNDPQLLFRLYPYGLFEDKGKNMTLFVKINIPDDCPPIHPSTKLHLTVRVCAVERKGRKQLHVHQLEPKVNSGVLYIPKIMSHKELLKIHHKELDIQISTSTG